MSITTWLSGLRGGGIRPRGGDEVGGGVVLKLDGGERGPGLEWHLECSVERERLCSVQDTVRAWKG